MENINIIWKFNNEGKTFQEIIEEFIMERIFERDWH